MITAREVVERMKKRSAARVRPSSTSAVLPAPAVPPEPVQTRPIVAQGSAGSHGEPIRPRDPALRRYNRRFGKRLKITYERGMVQVDDFAYEAVVRVHSRRIKGKRTGRKPRYKTDHARRRLKSR